MIVCHSLGIEVKAAGMTKVSGLSPGPPSELVVSTVFVLIDRFSEDIDLILDWNEVVSEDPNMDRSKTKQDQFNKAVPERSREYIERVLLPEVLRLVDGVCSAEIEV